MRVRSRRRRGRPVDPRARRRQTTRAGRRGADLRDTGSPQLVARRVIATGSADLPCDPLGVLLGHRLIDVASYNAGRTIGELLEQVTAGLGIRGVASSWRYLQIGAVISGAGGDGNVAAAERAWRILERLQRRLRPPLVAELVFAVAAGEWRPQGEGFIEAVVENRVTGGDRARITLVAHGLDLVSRLWSPPSTQEIQRM